MLDSKCHMTLKMLKFRIFGVKTSRLPSPLSNVIIDAITLPFLNLLTTSDLPIFAWRISLPGATSWEQYNVY